MGRPPGRRHRLRRRHHRSGRPRYQGPEAPLPHEVRAVLHACRSGRPGPGDHDLHRRPRALDRRRGHARRLEEALRPGPGVLYFARPRRRGFRRPRGPRDRPARVPLGGPGHGRRPAEDEHLRPAPPEKIGRVFSAAGHRRPENRPPYRRARRPAATGIPGARRPSRSRPRSFPPPTIRPARSSRHRAGAGPRPCPVPLIGARPGPRSRCCVLPRGFPRIGPTGPDRPSRRRGPASRPPGSGSVRRPGFRTGSRCARRSSARGSPPMRSRPARWG
ncbi:MAG: hypothetical protein MZV64_13010 [Ignavibacteriales bacterium]|nr:hypothetical protein [Ignavibacteriales bacterium]